MRKLISALSILALFTFSAAAQPDTLWTRALGGSYDENGKSVQQTSDGGYIIVGSTSSFGAGGPDVYLVKLDAGGTDIWSQTFGGNDYDRGASVQQTSDGGYIIVGHTASYGAGSSDVYLIKTDVDGNEEWSRTYGTSNQEWGNSVCQTSDGGYIITGATNSYGAGSWDILLIKTDTTGNREWQCTFGGTGWDEGCCVQQTTDEGYIVTGYIGIWPDNDVCLIKLDAEGNEEWLHTFGEEDDDRGFCVQQTSDGGYIIVGFTWSFSGGFRYVYLIKTDANGDVEWQYTYVGNGFDSGNSVQQTSDGGYIVGGYVICGGQDTDLYLLKTDDVGNEEWECILGDSTAGEYCSCVWQTSNGGYILAGSITTIGSPSSGDVWVLRFESEYVNVSLYPHSTPIQIPPGGGSFVFDIEIVNSSAVPYTVDVWTDITLPDGITYPIYMRENIDLPPGAVIIRSDLTQFVPGSTVEGIYYYNAYVSDHGTWELFSYDSFPFEKIPGFDSPTHDFGWTLYGWDGSEEPVLSTAVPLEFILHQAYPNPFNLETTLRLELPKAGDVSLVIYDIQGREVVRLIDSFQQAGIYEVDFNASEISSGVYFASLTAGGLLQTRKMLLVK